jgi:hypothetical protein
MKKCLFNLLLICFTANLFGQQIGDTIKISAFKYGSNTRDTAINFPNNANLSFEKIIMKYNMRCKNGLISTSQLPNQGCGQWDYSCNTFIVDSTKIETVLNTAPTHVISNFSGNTFVYTSQTIYDYYNFTQNPVVLNNILSENQYSVGAGNTAAPNVLKSNEKSGKSQILFTAAELTAAGLVAGNINGLVLSVANNGGTVNFFRVNIQHSNASNLNGNTPTVTGFTNVFNSNFAFTSGNNRIQFHTPFVWNGTSNVLIELSFTNTGPSNPIVFNGVNTATTMALYAKNNYALDLSANGHVVINTASLSSISSEITMMFWAYGDAASMPSAAQFVYGYDNSAGNRQFSLQLPWNDNNVYFDCGYAAGSYDRLNKVATAANQGGQWNHWAFTKNATSGVMRIYLNGVLWASGTGKTKLINILNLILGKDASLQNNYKGKLNELSIWNKELALADIQGWMNKPLTSAHPLFGNLLAYYKADEGAGLNINDSKNGFVSNGFNLQWSYDRGDNLTRMFSETTVRPNIVFLRGNYASTTSTIVVKDSVARNPNIVQQYTVVSNAGQPGIVNDALNVISTTNQYQILPSKIYNGDTGALTGTLAVAPQGTINIGTLNYFRRFPFYNEIMSFVTPYGIGLNLGAAGKTWYFDMTDFTPLLKGRKRMMMSLGGEYQEQMDIDFWFIVGTPPSNLLQFNQLWQGAARAGDAGIGSVNNDTRFSALNVPVLNNGQYFKLRSTITGHGSAGEFQQNGGQINHFFNLNGGPNEFTWQISKDCSFNPVYPQGGTWVYDRQGWCPGETSVVNEFNVTPFVTPGSTVTMDYNCSPPPNPSGDYRFIVANQLITYGGANHSLDASIIDVLAPTNKVLYARTNPMCNNPVILVKNTGSGTLTQLEIEYWLNNSTNKQTYTWTGSLAFRDTAVVVLPINTIWDAGLQTTGNIFNAELKKANGAVDQYAFNNSYRSPFIIPDIQPREFTIEFKTNNLWAQNTYSLLDEYDNLVGQSNFSAANTSYNDNYNLSGCYRLIVEDSGNDGLQWFANAAQGAGYVRLKDTSGNVIKVFNPDFGRRFEYSFTTAKRINTTTIEDFNFSETFNVYPNPAHGKLMIEGTHIQGSSVTINNVLGQKVAAPMSQNKSVLEFDTSNLTPGVYFITIKKEGKVATKKIIVQ